MNRERFAPGEWYHCFTRGVDKRRTFTCPEDYQRFLEVLFLCNNKGSVHRSNLKQNIDVFSLERDMPLVHIGAFCLMPNHFHLLIQEIDGRGISTFMQKLGTSYSMYFNKRHERIGNLFVKPFRSKHVSDDLYARQVSAYIHLNPLDLKLPNGAKSASTLLTREIATYVETYPYSSFNAYLQNSTPRKQDAILSESAVELFSNYQANCSTTALLEHASDFLSR